MNSLISTTPTQISVSLPLDQNPAAMYLASLPAASGRRTQAQALRVIAALLGGELETLDWAALRHQHTSAIRSHLTQQYAPATVNKMLSALRKTLEKAFLLGQMSAEDYQRAVKLDPITGETIPAGRHISPDEIAALMETCKSDPNRHAGVRDAAMFALMYIAMLRREEVANLRRENYNPQTGRLNLVGKRSKQRTTYVSNGAKTALDAWIGVRGNDPGALFVAINKSGKLDKTHTHMTPYAVRKMLTKRARSAGVQDITPHDFRRTGASDYLDAGVDVITVSKMGGWSSVKTVSLYDRRPEEAKKKASSLLHVPY